MNKTKLALAGATALASIPRAIVGCGVRADGSDPAAILADLQRAFSEFRAVNDRRLAALETGRGDVLNEEHVNRINAALTELQTAHDEQARTIAALRLGGAGRSADTPEARAYAQAFDRAFRRGGDDAELHAMAVRAALTTQSDPDGGWLAPTEIESTIDRVLSIVSAMRGLATVRQIRSGTYEKLVGQGGATAGWVGEAEARPETATPKLAALSFEAMELYANAFASQTMLDDGIVDIGAWLGDEISIAFAEQEGPAFISGSGVKKPRGILSYPTVADGNYAWGKIGYVGTGGAGLAADPDGLDAFIDLTSALKQAYRPGAAWVMNRKTEGAARKLKDSQGHYQWVPPTPGQTGPNPATLLGYPIANDDSMPDIGAGAFPVAFGDFRRGYLIVDRMGIRVLRDPYTNKPKVGFYTTKRVGGGVQMFEAIKLLKCA